MKRRRAKRRELYRSRTLEQLDGQVWPEPALGSHVVTTCHLLRKRPIAELTIEDLRLLIGQGIGLRFLGPVAVERLVEDPLAEGDLYPGDLLKSVLSVAPAFWEDEPEARAALAEALRAAPSFPPEVAELVTTFLRD